MDLMEYISDKLIFFYDEFSILVIELNKDSIKILNEYGGL